MLREGCQGKACLSLCSLSPGAPRGVPGEGLSVCRHRHALFHSLALLSALTFPLIYPRLFVNPRLFVIIIIFFVRKCLINSLELAVCYIYC